MPKAKQVLVTGCAQGIGRAIAEEFAANGWEVIGIDIQPLEGIGCLSRRYCLDVAKADEVAKLSAQIATLDCLINNAAIQIEKGLLNTTSDEWNRVLGANLSSAFYLIQALSSKLQGGSIINISSVHARATSPGLCAYATSKGGLSALTRAAALELAPMGIRVNSILPGAIETNMLRKGLGRTRSEADAREKLIAGTPLKRVGMPQEVAKLALFLAQAELAGNITGQEFVCDGGVLARLASE